MPWSNQVVSRWVWLVVQGVNAIDAYRRQASPRLKRPVRTMLLSGNMDALERDYHLGIGLTREFTEHFSWAFFNAGALCLQVTNQTVEQLNAGILSIVLPGLAELAGDPEAPIAITLAPQQIPEVVFGENRFEVDEEGTRTLVDPAIRILIPELWIDFHLFMDDRWARIFSLHTNVDIPLGLDFTPIMRSYQSLATSRLG